MDISVCMIVKDEEGFLADCLDSVKNYASEIVIADTGSTDRTKEIAAKYTDKIYDFQWINDFGAARNFSVSRAANDWVMFLDADERLVDYKAGSVQGLLSQPDKIGCVLLENDYGPGEQPRYSKERLSRIFNRQYYEFEGNVHEQLVRRDGKQKSFLDIDLRLIHLGYSREVVRAKNKDIRNRTLLESALKEKGDDPYLYFHLGKTYTVSEKKDYKKAAECFERALGLEQCRELRYFFDLVNAYGYALINSGQYAKALSILKYKDMYADRADFVFLLGHIYMNNAMFDEAVGAFRRCLSVPDGKAGGVSSYLAHFNIGVICECTGNIQQAVKSYKACGSYAPAKTRLKGLGA